MSTIAAAVYNMPTQTISEDLAREKAREVAAVVASLPEEVGGVTFSGLEDIEEDFSDCGDFSEDDDDMLMLRSYDEESDAEEVYEDPLTVERNDSLWTVVPGFSKYEVNKNGKLRNAETKHQMSLKPRADGYVALSLFNDQNVRVSSVRVHRLIASTYLPNPTKAETVNHRNKIRHDNRLINLEWSSRAEQAHHACLTRIRPSNQNHRPVWRCDKTTKVRLQLYESLKAAADAVNCSGSAISIAASGTIKACKGFIWRYADATIQSLPGEVWAKLTCVSTTRDYQISTLGRIVGRNNLLHKHYLSSSGYITCSVEQKVYQLHVLVAKTFVPNPDAYPIINHKDGNKDNPAASNLEWISHAGNTYHAGTSNLTNRPIKSVECFNKATGIWFNTFKTMVEAAQALNTSVSDISSAVKGKRAYCAGHVWKYVDEDKEFEGFVGFDGAGNMVDSWITIDAVAASLDRTPNTVVCHLLGRSKFCNGLKICPGKVTLRR